MTADIYQDGAVSRYTDKAADLLDIKGWLNPVIQSTPTRALSDVSSFCEYDTAAPPSPTQMAPSVPT